MEIKRNLMLCHDIGMNNFLLFKDAHDFALWGTNCGSQFAYMEVFAVSITFANDEEYYRFYNDIYYDDAGYKVQFCAGTNEGYGLGLLVNCPDDEDCDSTDILWVKVKTELCLTQN